MAIDFNEAEQQSSGKKYGPVPMGSKVMLKMELKESTNHQANAPFIAVSRGGVNMLWIEFTVMGGEYDGVHWRENWMLPVVSQTVSLTEGQRKGCNISYSRMRAILEAVRHINPSDKSAQANAKRSLATYMDLNGLIFPAVLGIAKEGREGKDRNGNPRIYWDNVVSAVITPDRSDYSNVMSGKDWINPNGITSRDTTPATPAPAQYDDPFASAPSGVQTFPSEQAGVDGCPF